MTPRTGFVGLGAIGRPMAERLLAAGFSSTVFDLAAEPCRALARQGAAVAASLPELARSAAVIGLCVRDDAQVRAVVLGDNGLLAGARSGATLVLHSTILPRTVRQVAEAAAAHDVHVLDACVTGGPAGARSGTLTVMVGGRSEDLERCRTFLASFASRVVHTGPLGSGAATKLCNNLMTYLGFLAAREATRLACAAGVSEEALDEVTRANGNMTEQMRAFLHLHRLPAPQRTHELEKMLRGYAALAEKDLELAIALAGENGIRLPGAAYCRDLMGYVYGVEPPEGAAPGEGSASV